MPIVLDAIEQNTQVVKNKLSPQFFSSSLTGSGGKAGLLNATRLPARNAATAQISPQRCRDLKTTISSGTSDYEFIPTRLADLYGQLTVDNIPDMAVCVSNDTTPLDRRVYMHVTMNNMVYVVTDKGQPTRKRELYCMYDIHMYEAQPNSTQYRYTVFTEPALNVQQFISYKYIDTTLLDNYFNGLLVYDIVINTADCWINRIPEIVKIIIDNNMNESVIRDMCIRMNNYSVNLMDYKAVYDYIEANKPDWIDTITQVNLNLLLNATLKTLEQNKPNIPTFTPQPWNLSNPKLSNEQLKAVCTTEPCCIVQAGAGTGKSTVINNRINYLAHCGVDLSNVMVLSFTNAAANHIKDIAPAVNSKTIASMIHDIYAMNYDHGLSTIDTMINSLKARKSINNSSNRVGLNLINALQYLKKDINGGLIDLSNLISNHFDEVINILNTIKQTTLELESIICYHAKNLIEPNGLCEHLIMDEVQDNSIFEFIYIINYVVRHNACLYLVGDCSQTLYEFRASNPKALNCLEMSGVFECMQLQTNYRSNQNILDFANLTLNTIEANQFAKIQLRANNFQAGAFEDDVKVNYYQLLNMTKAVDDHFMSMMNDIKEWVREKVANGEQVAFLAYLRKDLEMFEKAAEILFPNCSLVNIVPAKCYNNSFFSKYILFYGEDFVHKIGADVTIEVMRHIIDNIDTLCRNDAQKANLRALIAEWQARNINTFKIRDMELAQGLITDEMFKEDVFVSMTEFEIEKNAMKQRLVSAANEKIKEEDISGYNFVLSTIHSAKGLEFDNVILLYNESKKDSEEDKRMYYVGLTRAKKSERIIAFNTRVNSDILSAYNLMCQAKSVGIATDEDGNTIVVDDEGFAVNDDTNNPSEPTNNNDIPTEG